MTDALREAAQAALEELERVSEYWGWATDDAKRDNAAYRLAYCERQRDRVNEQVAALRAALAEPAERTYTRAEVEKIVPTICIVNSIRDVGWNAYHRELLRRLDAAESAEGEA